MQHESISNELYFISGHSSGLFLNAVAVPSSMCCRKAGRRRSKHRPFSSPFSCHEIIIFSLLQACHCSTSPLISEIVKWKRQTSAAVVRRVERLPPSSRTSAAPEESYAAAESLRYARRGAFQESQQGKTSCGGREIKILDKRYEKRHM